MSFFIDMHSMGDWQSVLIENRVYIEKALAALSRLKQLLYVLLLTDLLKDFSVTWLLVEDS